MYIVGILHYLGKNNKKKCWICSVHVSKIKAFTIQLVMGILLACVLDYNELFKAIILKER